MAWGQSHFPECTGEGMLLRDLNFIPLAITWRPWIELACEKSTAVLEIDSCKMLEMWFKFLNETLYVRVLHLIYYLNWFLLLPSLTRSTELLWGKKQGAWTCYHSTIKHLLLRRKFIHNIVANHTMNGKHDHGHQVKAIILWKVRAPS